MYLFLLLLQQHHAGQASCHLKRSQVPIFTFIRVWLCVRLTVFALDGVEPCSKPFLQLVNRGPDRFHDDVQGNSACGSATLAQHCRNGRAATWCASAWHRPSCETEAPTLDHHQARPRKKHMHASSATFSILARSLSRGGPLCQAMTAEASAGDQWTSGRALGWKRPRGSHSQVKSWPPSFAEDLSTP